MSKNREPQIGIDGFGDSSINFTFRFWVPAEKVHQFRLQVNDRLFDVLTDAGVQIPCLQREVRILGDAARTAQ